ncbi:amidohydrolase family protein [Roseimicrobium sp. ORNL1]|uniref:amidohydrolase family protein n=1 Tax=Roseimicrobium sp. ORNL1 TaxID=2711231 RepID=UPI0013E13DF2|nr:amidohydrolase family protein [Roseimicrobium sp. ORNL1]QIF05024.1 amidohydrolase [Roseimicrobium sp. ORNL1]
MSTKPASTSRRTFLRSAALAALSAPAFAQAADDNDVSKDCIDAHVHVWTPDTDRYPLGEGATKKGMDPASFTPEELFAHTKPNGVSRIVLIQMSFYQFDNQYMLDAMKAHPGVFGGVAIVDESEPDVADTMKQLAKQGVRGFRIYTDKEKAEAWQSSPGMKAMWSCAADAGLSMCLLANPDALPAVQKMCAQYPKTRVVIDHFARIGMKGAVDQKDLDNLCRLADAEHTFVKTSAFYALGAKKAPYTDLGPMIQRLRDTYGAKRLMWASDCPFQVGEGHNYKDSIALIRERLDFLSPEDKAWMLRKTAEKVFFS